MDLSRKKLIILITTVILLVALPLTLYLVRQTQIFKPRATGEIVTFSLVPQTATKTVGQPLDVDVNLATGAVGVDALLLTIEYDPVILRLDRFDDNLAAQLGNVKNEIDIQKGRLTYESVETGSTTDVRGSFKVGTLRFTTLATTPANTPTQVTFQRAVVGSATTTGLVVVKPIGSYMITSTGSALGNISVNVFADKDKDGTKDSDEPFINGMQVSLTGTASRGPLNTDQNGNANFTALTSGNYAVSLNLTNADLEVLNPTALNVNLTSGSASTQIRLGPKTSGLTPVTGNGGGPTFTYTNGASSPALYGGIIYGKNLEKLEIYRVRNSTNANTIANRANWIPVLANFPCANLNSCSNNNTSIGVWENITDADIGEWIVFIEGYSYSGQKCTGNPFVYNALLEDAGYTDCGPNDVVTTTVAGSGGGIPSPSPSPAASQTASQTPSQAPVAVPTPTLTMVTANGCLSGPVTGTALQIQWVNNNYHGIDWVDISTSANFATYYHKTHASFIHLNAYTSTYAPEGFNGFVGASGPLTMNPNTTYYVRLFDGTRHSNTVSINVPLCSSTPPINQCPTGQILCARTGFCMTTTACNTLPPSPSVASCTQSNGDANKDGRVNGIDFTIWSNEFLGNIVNQADFNCDGRVNGIDFTIWSNAFLSS